MPNSMQCLRQRLPVSGAVIDGVPGGNGWAFLGETTGNSSTRLRRGTWLGGQDRQHARRHSGIGSNLGQLRVKRVLMVLVKIQRQAD